MTDHSRAATPSEGDSCSEIQFPQSLRSEYHLAPQSQSPMLDGLFRETFTNDIQERIIQTEEKNLLLSVENEILEKYLLKVDPVLIQGMEKLLEKVNEKTAKAQIISQSLEPISRAGSRASQASKPDSLHSVGPISIFTLSGIAPPSESVKIPHISYEFRHDIVNREMNNMKSKLSKLIVRMKAEKTHIAASMEELAFRVEDSKEFRRKLMQLSQQDSPAKKINLEVYLGFMKGVLKHVGQSINQAKTNMTILSIEKKRVLLRMEDKQELSSTIYPIDFDVLEIQNQELRKQLKQKCLDLSAAKRALGTTERSLLSQANKYKSICGELRGLHKKIKFNKRKLKNIKTKQRMLELEIKQGTKRTVRPKTPIEGSSIANIEALDVMSYAFTKLCLVDLKRKLKICSRKRQIKLAVLNTMRHHFKMLVNNSPIKSKRPWLL